MLPQIFYKERRRDRRHPCTLRAILRLTDGRSLGGSVIDLSSGGFRFRPSQLGIFLHTPGAVLTLYDVTLDCKVVRRAGGRLHCRFHTPLQPGPLRGLLTGDVEERRHRFHARLAATSCGLR